MEKNRILKSIIVIFISCVFVLLYGGIAYASEEIYFDNEGNLIYITYDKKATSSVSYKAIGWILKRYDAPINAAGQQYVIVRKIEYAVDDPENPGYLYCYFWSDKDEILSAVEKVSPQWREQLEEYGSTIYIDNVMTVCNSKVPLGNVDQNGNCTGEVYYTFEGIKNARPWARPEFLKSYFDIKLQFPVLVKYPPMRVNKNNETFSSVGSSMLLAMSVGSSEYGNEIYDVGVAMPAGEELYFKGQCDSYQYELTVGEYTGTAYVPVRVDTDYVINWVDTSGRSQSETKKVSRWYSVPKSVTYTRLVEYDIWDLDAVNMYSQLLNERVSVGHIASKPRVVKREYGDAINHINNTTYSFYTGRVVLSSGNYIKPSIPEVDYSATAAKAVSSVLVRSDYLSIEGKVILSDEFLPNRGSSVGSLVQSKKELYQSKVKTNEYAYNQLYDDFEMICTYKSRATGKIMNCTNRNINGVNIHTPVVCKGKIYGDKKINQAKEPENSDITLGGNIYININNTGKHNDIKGYGTRDYSDYVGGIFVKFQFPVRKGEAQYPAGEWIRLESDIETLKLPDNIPLGDYQVYYKVIAKNGNENSYLGEICNYSQKQYGAVGSYKVNVIGRMYDLEVDAGEEYVAGDLDKDGNKLSDFSKLILPYQYSLTSGESVNISLKTMGDVGEEVHVKGEIKYLYWDVENEKLVPVDLYKTGYGLKTETFEKLAEEIIIDHCIQTDENNVYLWSTEYMLPDNFVAVQEGEEIVSLEKDRDKILRDSYVFMVFEFVLENDNYKTLMYVNKDNQRNGFCNMWSRQGGVTYAELNGEVMDIDYGTLFVMELPQKIKYDYEVNGTH